MNEMLLDDYLVMYIDSGDKEYLTRVISVLDQCSFDKNTITEIINMEIEIIKFRKEIKKPIINHFYWFDNMNRKTKVFKRNLNDYLLLRYICSNIKNMVICL